MSRGRTTTRIAQPVEDMAWQELAACSLPPGSSTEAQAQRTLLFYPDQDRGRFSQREAAMIRQAKKLCAGCPVRTDCLEYAQSPPVEIYGIWGGKTPAERARLRKARRDQAGQLAAPDVIDAALKLVTGDQ